jgi:hypothetical protein
MDRLTPDDERFLDDARRRAVTHSPPTTIADLKTEGCIGFTIYCSRRHTVGPPCSNSRLMRWEDVNLPDDLAFPRIVGVLKVRCTRCRSREFHIRPDATHWQRPGY